MGTRQSWEPSIIYTSFSDLSFANDAIMCVCLLGMKIILARRKRRRKQLRTRKVEKRTNEDKRLVFQIPVLPPPHAWAGYVVMAGAQFSIYVFYLFSFILNQDRFIIHNGIFCALYFSFFNFCINFNTKQICTLILCVQMSTVVLPLIR